MRSTAKRRSTVSGARPEPKQSTSSLESALHSLLSNVPEGLTRCRKNILPTVEGSPSVCSPSVRKTVLTPRTKQERTERKQTSKREDEQIAALENQEDVEKMRVMTRKVLRYQNSQSSLDGDKVSGAPRRSEKTQDTPGTPRTPRTRDYFFANNGDVGSPWTILSPFTCSQRNNPQRNRPKNQDGLSFMSGGDDFDGGVWESDEGNCLPCYSNSDSLTSPSNGSASLPECLSQRAVSQGPILRSVSMDETRRSPASAQMGDLFQRSMSQRSYSSGSRTENMREEEAGVRSLLENKARNHIEGQVSTSRFLSFFRRIGGRSKPGDVEEQNFKGWNS